MNPGSPFSSPAARRVCRQCGAALRPRFPGSVCPKCMIESAAASPAAWPGEIPREETGWLGLTLGDYVLEKEIAHGGMGVVYRARQLSLGRTVAVKLLLLGRHSSPESIQRFQREARSAAALRHPHIVPIFEVGEYEGQHFFSMELIEGQDLAQRLREGPLPLRQGAEYLQTIARTVHYAHSQGVLHRDLKPSNVLIDASGEPRLTDFGLAKPLDGSSDLTETGRLLGSPNYLSPEAAAGRADALGPASDVYSLGAMLYELLTGRPPFLAPSLPDTLLRIRDAEPVSPRRLNPAVPVDLETICLKGLEKAPAARYATAQELAEDLGRWLRSEPILARPVPAWERAWKWSHRNPRVAVLLLVSVLAGLGLIATLTIANARIRLANARTAVEAEESRQRLVRLNVQTGNRHVADRDPLTALAWFVEALALERGDPGREEIHRRQIGAILRRAPELEQIWFQDTFVNDARISADHTRVTAVSLNQLATCWDARTGRAIAESVPASQVRLSPDNRYWLTWLVSEGTRLWNLADGTPVPEWLKESRALAEFSPDGRRLALPTREGVKRIDAATGEPLGDPLWTPSLSVNLLFSPNGRWLVSYCDRNRMTAWHITSDGEPRWVIDAGEPLRFWIISDDSSRIAAVLESGRIRQWKMATGERAGPDLQPASAVFSLDYSPDGKRLATAEWEGAAYLWEVDSGQRVGPPLAHQGGVKWVRYSPDGTRLATASWDTTVRFWDPESGHPRAPVLRHGGFVTALDFSADGTRLVTGCQDTAVRLWRLATHRPARLELWHGSMVYRVCYDPTGGRIVSAGADGTARVWDRENGTLLFTLHHAGPVMEASFSPDGRYLLTASLDGTARLWDAASGEPLFPGVSHGDSVVEVEFSPNGRWFLTRGVTSPLLRIWDVETGQAAAPPLDFGSKVSAVTFHPDGTRLIVGSDEGFAQVWDVETGRPAGPRLAVGGSVCSATFSPDGKRILTSWADDGQLPAAAQMWDTATGAKVGLPMWHLDGIYRAEFSPDGRRIVTAAQDNSARVWDAATGEPVTAPLRHRAFVYCAKFSPDGRLVATASEDGSARLWETETGEAVTPPLEHEGRAGWAEWSPDGREIVTGWNQDIARVFDVSPYPGSVERLRLQAELLGSQRLHPTSGAAPLTAAELRQRWEAFRGSK